ncbi:MAG: hypothetical protein IPM42_07230 [Saprospiraceae bacterium]|nr:hypothetical protein [Saprospiraceae bacterium]
MKITSQFIIILFISCASLKNNEVPKPVNQFVYKWEKAILEKAVEINKFVDCKDEIRFYTKHLEKIESDDYYLVSLFNHLLESGKIASLKDSFYMIHESTVDNHYFYLVKSSSTKQMIEKYRLILGEWKVIGTTTYENIHPIFIEDDFECKPNGPEQLFQSAIFTKFYEGTIVVEKFIPQVCEKLNHKLSTLVKVPYRQN